MATGLANDKIPDDVRACVDKSPEGITLESARGCMSPLSDEVPCLVKAFKSDAVWDAADGRDRSDVRGAVIAEVDACEGW